MTTASREECTELLGCIRFDDDDGYVWPLIVPQEKFFSPAEQNIGRSAVGSSGENLVDIYAVRSSGVVPWPRATLITRFGLR